MRWSAAQAMSWIIRHEPRNLRDWTAEMGPEIARAERQLSKAIADGRVQAWGRKQDKEDRAHGLLEPIPGDQFKLKAVSIVVTLHGDMRASPAYKQYSGPRWREIEFNADEVRKNCTPPPPSAEDWMLHEARKAKGRPGKRDDMVRRCMDKTGCTMRQAQAAHKRLPQEFRRTRGKPSK